MAASASASAPVERRRTRGGHRSALCRHGLTVSPEQAVLDVLKASSADVFARTDFGQQLLSIKRNFVARDYNAVFQTPEHLPIYAAQYAPGRALCYLDLFRTEPLLLRFLVRRPRLRALCVGGGAGSEFVALAACRALLELRDPPPPAVPPGPPGPAPAATADGAATVATAAAVVPLSTPAAGTVVPARMLEVHVHDLGDWGDVLHRQADTIRSQWQFAPGTDAGELRFQFVAGDVLAAAAAAGSGGGGPEFARQVARADLVTAMFVINELLVTRERTMALLKLLHDHMRPGALLLVVDSAGDFSHIAVGRHTFMVYTLLDSLRGWKRLIAHDAQWYRVADGLRYPLEVQNMRYFVRLYQREAAGTSVQAL